MTHFFWLNVEFNVVFSSSSPSSSSFVYDLLLRTAIIEIISKAMSTVTTTESKNESIAEELTDYSNLWEIEKYKEDDFWFMKIGQWIATQKIWWMNLVEWKISFRRRSWGHFDHRILPTDCWKKARIVYCRGAFYYNCYWNWFRLLHLSDVDHWDKNECENPWLELGCELLSFSSLNYSYFYSSSFLPFSHQKMPPKNVGKKFS